MNMPDVPKDILRDTLFIWMYITMTRFDDVQNGATSDQLLQDLEQNTPKPHIKAADPQNQRTAQEAVKLAKTFAAQISAANDALGSLTVLKAPWTGGGQHPKLSELDSIYIAPRP
jgi:hypothetical protein